MVFNYISVPPLPIIILLLPFCSAALIACLRFINFILRFKASGGKAFRLGRLPLKIIFFTTIVLETLLTLYLWYRFQSIRSASYVLSYTGWATTLTGLASSALRTDLQIDILSASAAVMASLVALISCFRAMSDKQHLFTPRRAVFFLLTLGGVMGIYFSSGLFGTLVALALSQLGASGLVQPILHERREFGRTVAYFISRFMLLSMFLAGCTILMLRSGLFGMQVLSAALRGESAERTALALMAAPLLYLFIKPPHYTTDSANRCYFSIRAHAAFFAFFKIVFVLYGAIAGLERIPALIGLVGIASIFASLMFMAGERDPIRFATAAESSLKGFILVALAISLGSIYSAASVAAYGYDATEAVISLWLLFLPVSAALSLTSVQLKQEFDGAELWRQSGMASKLPFTGIVFVFSICMLSGLPPLTGYAGRQLLYRSANHLNPFLTIALFVASLSILFMGLRYIFAIMFGKRNDEAAVRFAGDRHITLPLFVLTCIILTGTILPGFFHGRVVQPSVNLLVGGVRHIGNAQYWNESDAGSDTEGNEIEYDGDGNALPAEEDDATVREEGSSLDVSPGN